jgi:2,4-dichlorophenol 6-monooxygenase
LSAARGAWSQAAEACASTFGISLDVRAVGPDADLVDRDGAWQKLRSHGEDGAVLVRPDGHVAFRAQNDDDAQATLARALERALGRSSARAVGSSSSKSRSEKTA